MTEILGLNLDITISLEEGVKIRRGNFRRQVDVEKEFEALGGHFTDEISKSTHHIAQRDQFTKERLQTLTATNPEIQVLDRNWLDESLKVSSLIDIGDHLLYPNITIGYACYSNNDHKPFATVTSADMNRFIRRLGGKRSYRIQNCTHVIATRAQFEQKSPAKLISDAKKCSDEVRIVTYDWLEASVKASRWVEVWDHLLYLSGFTIAFAQYTDEGHAYFSGKDSEEVIGNIKKRGGKYITNVKKCNYLVVTDHQYKENSNGSIQDAKSCTHEVRIVSYAWLADSLRTRKWINAKDDMNDYLLPSEPQKSSDELDEDSFQDPVATIPEEGNSSSESPLVKQEEPSNQVWHPKQGIKFPEATIDTQAPPSKFSKLKRDAYMKEMNKEATDSLCRYTISRKDHWKRVKNLTAIEAKIELRQHQSNLSSRFGSPHEALDQFHALGNDQYHQQVFLSIFIITMHMEIDKMEDGVTKTCLVLLSVLEESKTAIFANDDYIIAGIKPLKIPTNALGTKAELPRQAKNPRRPRQAKLPPRDEAATKPQPQRQAKTPRLRPQAGPPAKPQPDADNPRRSLRFRP